MQWLEALGLGMYAKGFSEYGINSLADTLLLTEEDWKELDVKPFHAKKLMAAAKVEQPEEHWLTELGFPEYSRAFDEYGVDGLKDVRFLEDSDWKTLQVKPLHKRKLIDLSKKLAGGDEGDNISAKASMDVDGKSDSEMSEKDESEKEKRSPKVTAKDVIPSISAEDAPHPIANKNTSAEKPKQGQAAESSEKAAGQIPDVAENKEVAVKKVERPAPNSGEKKVDERESAKPAIEAAPVQKMEAAAATTPGKMPANSAIGAVPAAAAATVPPPLQLSSSKDLSAAAVPAPLTPLSSVPPPLATKPPTGSSTPVRGSAERKSLADDDTSSGSERESVR